MRRVTVPETEVEQAIVAHLVREPAGRRSGPVSPGGWTSSVGGGGPGADPSTIVFQRSRALPNCQMHQVGFTDHMGIPEISVIRTWRRPDRSVVVAPVGGGSPAPSRRTRPWVNFATGFGADGFAAGGEVVGQGSDRAHTVRLTFADGYAMEDAADDSAEHRIVLFFEPEGVILPADVEILDRRGQLLAAYKEFDGSPFTA
jgi:hypothetical protein